MKRFLTKRIYDPPTATDGRRILADRLWPRGLSKDKAAIDYWAKAAAPSDELRRWYQHDAAKWDEFRERYFAELDANPEAVAELRGNLAPEGEVTTLLFATQELELNNAAALRAYLARRA
ncbi:MAG: DUF488 family protein [Planctomycetota bacterium]